MINLQPSATGMDQVSPFEQFHGTKVSATRELRCPFGAFCHATVAVTNNSMAARTRGCIMLLPTFNGTGSMKMLSLSTMEVITCDQVVVLPCPDIISDYLTRVAERQGYSRLNDASIGADIYAPLGSDPAEQSVAGVPAVQQPTMLPIDDRPDVLSQAVAVEAGVVEGLAVEEQSHVPVATDNTSHHQIRHQAPEAYVRWSSRLAGEAADPYPLVMFSVKDATAAAVRRALLVVNGVDWNDWLDLQHQVFQTSVRAALKARGGEALKIVAELQQILDKTVWHGVYAANLSAEQRAAIIRSSMFLKDKYLASGEFDKYKARLVAGGDQQDKSLYDDLSSPTVSTTSVFTIAAIAAAEFRSVLTMDIGGAFLNASMKNSKSGVVVHMRLDKLMSTLLILLDPTYQKFLQRDGTLIVELDKALYGCVEAAKLWYEELRGTLLGWGFRENEYDVCVFNRMVDGVQVTIALHVDDLLVTSLSEKVLKDFCDFMESVYAGINTKKGKVLGYLGMCFDFTEPGQVSVTMENCVKDIISSSGVSIGKSTPATSALFEVRNAPKLSAPEAAYFHTHVAKIQYLAKRARPECLTAVSFLSTRVQQSDTDDLAKLSRLLGYIFVGTRDRGIVLRIGEFMTVSAYIDAAYGVHTESGKSHTGWACLREVRQAEDRAAPRQSSWGCQTLRVRPFTFATS